MEAKQSLSLSSNVELLKEDNDSCKKEQLIKINDE